MIIFDKTNEMEKHQKKATKLIFKHLDKIYKSSVKATKPFHPGMVSLVVLKVILNKSKLGKTESLPEEFRVQFNKTLDVLYTTCEANSTKTKLIPAVLFKSFIDIIKSGMSA